MPWRAVQIEPSDPQDPSWDRLWDVLDDDGHCHAFHCTEADAKLFAAAPELLNVLCDFLDHYGFDSKLEDMKIDKAARAAVEKATT